MNKPVTYSITNPALLDIHEGNALYHGGNQDWFNQPWQQQAGCGPTACTNLLWYLVKTHKEPLPLCQYDASQKSSFLQFMEEVWQHMPPGKMGINTTGLFVDGATQFGSSKGVPLTVNTLDISPACKGKTAYDKIANFIIHSLEQDLPVAFLNLSNGRLQNLDSWHWVTIVSLRENEALIFDQGRSRWINLKEWAATTLLGGGLVSLSLFTT